MLDIDAGTVTHHIDGCTFQNWAGEALVRYFSLEGDVLTLATAPVMMGGGVRRGYLVWNRDTKNDNLEE